MDTHKIFLVEPLDKAYQEMIVYADNEEEARLAAMQARSDGNVASIYLDENLTLCIESDEAEVTAIHKDSLRVKYNDVIYELIKNKAQEVINKQMF